jgi:uncharacterized protein (TIGR03118 family)
MMRPGHARRRNRRLGTWCAALAVTIAAGLAIAPGALALGHYNRHDLVSDQAGKADLMDPDLVNAWGLAFGPSTPAWVADAETGVATLYTGDTGGGPGYAAMARTPVNKVPLTVTIPGGSPTGQVYNGSNSFMVSAGGNSGPANFIFSSEVGKISAWSQDVPPLTQAHEVASAKDAIFKGLAIAKTKRGHHLYATDFHKGRVDVWNGAFHRIHRKGAFRDKKIPDDYAPFGIEALHGHLFVTYAKQDEDAEDDVPGAHRGFVDVFDKRGNLLRRFASHGPLNSPWAVVKAPKGFGPASGDLLIGNFGNGHINAYDPKSSDFIGPLDNKMGKKLHIDGLWALEFGNGVMGTSKTLLFTAGPDDEAHGLFGDVTAGG